MIKQHKPGDIVGVRVLGASDNGYVSIDVGNQGYYVPSIVLVPLPAAMTPEERAVLEEADARVSSDGLEHQAVGAVRSRLAGFVMALRASRQPPDPMKELREATEELFAASRLVHSWKDEGKRHQAARRIDDAESRVSGALAAVEAALKEKK